MPNRDDEPLTLKELEDLYRAVLNNEVELVGEREAILSSLRLEIARAKQKER